MDHSDKKIKTLMIALLFLGVAGHSLVSFSEDEEKTVNLTLQSGIDKVIDLSFKPLRQAQDTIVVGNKKVVRPIFILEKNQLILKPGEAGEASVTVRDTSGNIRVVYHVTVTAVNLSKMTEEVKNILRDVEGVSVRQVGEKIVLDGELVVPSDMNRIVAVKEIYGNNVVNLTTFSPLAQKIIAEKMQKDIKEQLGLDEIRVRAVNCRFFMEGVTDSAVEEKRAIEIAKSYAPDLIVQKAVKAKEVKEQGNKCKIVSFITQREKPAPPPAKMIKVVTQFVELSKDYMKFFGFKWAPGIATGGSTSFGQASGGGLTTVANSITGTINSLFPKLRQAKSSGKAKILETAVGITEDGRDLFINKQTQMSFLVGNFTNGQTMQTINYGLTASILPKRIGDENSEAVQLKLEFNLSVPTGVSPQGIPVITNNTVRNTITVNSNESAAIAGVVRSGTVWAYNKDPDQVEVESPIFSFLRSRQFNSDKSQFVIFVTPIIVENASKGTEEIKRKFQVK